MSLISTLPESLPSTCRSTSVLTPDSECRMRSNAFGSTSRARLSTGAPPYTTAGNRPVRRRRRASFLPRVCRVAAAKVACISSLFSYTNSDDTEVS